ncbi:hypothetical protein [Novosphingobium jiangmenense]|uniref:Flippase-like domain-containing protein n=1 Tax=Novosphingobium jiangmenense TaxID=2791981 RepID=A0ABS0HD52_9SPHN|nr:hypothetical protein [Novosphingobium jiangmenense]MBF9149901.1 hypothetical protein [Novosphingobium jiangmenense]
MKLTSTLTGRIDGLTDLRARLQILSARHRASLLIAATALFACGSWYAFRSLGLSPLDLDLRALLATVLLMPLSLLYSGLGLVLLSRCVGAKTSLQQATTIASYGTLAEALPVPGGAMVRVGALMAAGASATRSSLLVLMTAVLWIALASLGCGFALWLHQAPASWLLASVGLVGVIMTVSWLARHVGAKLTLLTVGHRFSGLVLIAVRLHFALLCLGLLVPPINTLPFALANIAGSAASIAPAGLGISESLAALVAGSVKVAPAAAFLAVGLDRLACLAASALAVLASLLTRGPSQAPQGDGR